MMMVAVKSGGFYKTRDGRKFGPAEWKDGFFSMNGWHYNCHGIHGFRGQTEHSFRKLDLISEWTETPAEVIGENVRVIPINEAPERDFGKILKDALEKGSAEVMEKIKNAMPLNPEEYGRAPIDATRSKYHRIIKGVEVDIYDILVAWGVTCPARQHAIKKLFMAGRRGAKGVVQDLDEAIQATERAKELVG